MICTSCIHGVGQIQLFLDVYISFLVIKCFVENGVKVLQNDIMNIVNTFLSACWVLNTIFSSMTHNSEMTSYFQPLDCKQFPMDTIRYRILFNNIFVRKCIANGLI